ncbi:MAG: sporulation protein YqfD, partial [Clostridia bacterium]|nr:sporulation protein YqfD [Clostridia bacterium]
FYISRKDYLRYADYFNENSLLISKKGLYYFFDKLRFRFGLICGALMFLFLCVTLSDVVFDIKIDGNMSISDDQIKARLSDYGIKYGCRAKDIDVHKVANTFLKQYSDVGWISVNFRGNIAYIELDERKSVQKDGDYSPTDLVAACDGQIDSIEILSGLRNVEVGQTVSAGDILASGNFVTETGAVLKMRSRGHVYAHVSNTFNIILPYNEPTDIQKSSVFARDLQIFGFHFSLGDKSGYDFSKRDQLYVFGKFLPCFMTTFYKNDTDYVYRKYSEEQLLKRANIELANAIEKKVFGKISEKITDYEFSDYGLLLRCRIESIEDIAKEVPST